jgi:hypothetical protein
MTNEHVQLLTEPSEESMIRERDSAGETIVEYFDEVSLERRRATVGRPAGTECGNSCTCS